MKATEFVTGIQHVGIPTNDIAKTVDFYCNLGFTVALQTVNEAAKEQVAFLQLKNLVIETYQNGKACGEVGAIDHIALDVTDIEKTFDAVKAEGYHLLDNEIQFLPFWEHGVRFFTILGPNAEKIEFIQKLQEEIKK
jgi:catechol 2,3-dioxygenase-like lactoylglutathione lyase family enzyme